MVSNVLDNIGNFLSTTGGMVTTLITLSSIGLVILGNKMREHYINKQIQKVQVLQSVQNAKNLVIEQRKTVEELKQNRLAKEALRDEANETLMRETATAEEKAKAQEILNTIDAEIAKAQEEENIARRTLDIYEAQAIQSESNLSIISKISSGLTG